MTRPRVPVAFGALALLALCVAVAWAQDAVGRPPERLDATELRPYQQRLAAVVSDLPAGASAAAIFGPLFELACERSASSTAVKENRAALTVAAMYLSGWSSRTFVANGEDWPAAPQRRLRLAGRRDLAQHFGVSALLAAMAGSPAADVIGFYKELEDSRRSSGFSFSDVAANRAGMRLGEAAVSLDRAGDFQERLAAGVSESDIIPSVRDLPDNLTSAELQSSYGGPEGQAFKALVAEIERRIEELPLYR